MRNWKHSINIKQYLQEDVPVSTVVTGVKRELERLPESLRIDDMFAFEDIIEGFNAAAEEESVELFDETLENLYDWADENNVWLGLK